MFNLKRFFKKKAEFKDGVIPDDRPTREKMKDYEREEIAKSTGVEWNTKPKSKWPKYPETYQNGSGSCVAQSVSAALGIENLREEGKYIKFSPRDLYSRRENEGSGMYTIKALKDVTKNGITLECLMPSFGKSEEEMNKDNDRKPSDKIIAKIFKPKDKYYLAIKSNPDSIAEVLEEGHGVMMTVKFKRGEWDKKIPEIGSGYGRSWNYHKITAIDYFLYNGKKAILIKDSWGADKGFEGRRIVMPEWFNQGRIYSCHYFEALDNNWLLEKDDNEEDIERPSYEFNEDLEYHDRNDSVAKLQEALKIEGFFPKNTVCTGYYGGITRKAVKEFQYHYEVAPKEELEAVDGFRVGPSTRKKLNELFN